MCARWSSGSPRATCPSIPRRSPTRRKRIPPRCTCPRATPIPAIEVEREEWEEDSADRLSVALEKLDERSRNILKRRWMTDNKATLHELADEYGISAERVRQVESNAISKLKGLMAAA